MAMLTTTLSIPEYIAQGLATGIYERVGGIVRDTQTKQVVMWLRDMGQTGQVPPSLPHLLPSIGAAASVLNLAIATMGFAVVCKRLDDLEQRLQRAQEMLKHIGAMFDISFYANFRAALDLASYALTMNNTTNRRSSALQAISQFAMARHHYTMLVDTQLEQRTQVVDEYLATLTLAYIAEARCCLDIDEIDTAERLLHQGVSEISSRVRRHVQTLLTSNPAAYLHPSLRETVDLRRLTQVLRWLDPSLDENAVFEAQRENLFSIARSTDEWIQTLPPAIWNSVVDLPDQGGFQVPIFGFRIGGESVEPKVFQRLSSAIMTMEALIEDTQRLASYHAEVQALQRLGIPFNEWKQLSAPADEHSDRTEALYILIDQPFQLSNG